MNRSTWVLALALSAIVWATGAASAVAESVGVKYTWTNTLLAPTDVAGVVPQANWNNAIGGGQAPPSTPMLALTNDAGAASTIDLTAWTVTAVNGWVSGESKATPNSTLFYDYSGNSPTATFALGADWSQYDLYVYYSASWPYTAYKHGVLGLSDGTNTLATQDVYCLRDASGPYGSGGFYDAVGFVVDQPTGTALSNYAVFSGLTAKNLIVDFAVEGSELGFAAFQFVKTGVTPPVWPNYLPGDFNKDGQVGPEDFGILKDTFGTSNLAHGQHESWTLGDANDDGQIGPEDFGLLKDSFGLSNGPTGTYPLANVPEPVSLGLLVAALPMLLRRRAKA